MQTIRIDPRIAPRIIFDPIHYYEDTPIRFRNRTMTWPGTYRVTVWNSSVKNNLVHEAGLDKDGEWLDWPVKPYDMGLLDNMKPKEYYFEIFDKTINRIVVSGELHVKP